jgi:hypothetical protein
MITPNLTVYANGTKIIDKASTWHVEFCWGNGWIKVPIESYRPKKVKGEKILLKLVFDRSSETEIWKFKYMTQIKYVRGGEFLEIFPSSTLKIMERSEETIRKYTRPGMPH